MTVPPKSSRSHTGLRLAVLERHAEEFEPVADEAVAELARHGLLQPLDLLVAELDDLAGLHVDQVIVVAEARGLVTGAAVAEFMTLEDACALEQAHGAIDRRERDARIPSARPPVDLFDVGMVLGLRQHPGDGAPLARHAHAALGAEPFEPAFRDRRLAHLAALRPRPPRHDIIGKGASKGKAEDRGIGAVSVITLPAADRLGAAGAIEPKRRFVAGLHLEKQPLRAPCAQALDGRLKQGLAETLVAAWRYDAEGQDLGLVVSFARDQEAARDARSAVADITDQAERPRRRCELCHSGLVPGALKAVMVESGENAGIKGARLPHAEPRNHHRVA